MISAAPVLKAVSGQVDEHIIRWPTEIAGIKGCLCQQNADCSFWMCREGMPQEKAVQLYTGSHWRVEAATLADVEHFTKFAVSPAVCCFSHNGIGSRAPGNVLSVEHRSTPVKCQNVATAGFGGVTCQHATFDSPPRLGLSMRDHPPAIAMAQ